MLGFTSVDYTTVDLALILLGAVAVPLQTSAPVTQLLPIVVETEPSVIASSVDYLADAVELVLTGHVPARLVVFDYHPEVDDQREAVDAARARLAKADRPVIVETLADVLGRGKTAVAPAIAREEEDPLTLLIYTSGSTGAPKGAMHPERLVANYWRRSTGATWGLRTSEPSITLNFMPMSHVMARSILYGTLGTGGTAYFAAKSDLSTLLEDLALVRPTQLNFVPRIWDIDKGHQSIRQGKRLLAVVGNSQFQQEIGPSHHPQANTPITLDLRIDRGQRIGIDLDHIVEKAHRQAHDTLQFCPVNTIVGPMTIAIHLIARSSKFH